jgi:hypothetical protein
MVPSVHSTVPFPCFLASLTCFFASLIVVASMGLRYVYNDMLNNVISLIACVSMNYQNPHKQIAKGVMLDSESKKAMSQGHNTTELTGRTLQQASTTIQYSVQHVCMPAYPIRWVSGHACFCKAARGLLYLRADEKIHKRRGLLGYPGTCLVTTHDLSRS